MIDRLEEVLGKGDSQEEKFQLEELLRPWGAAISPFVQELEAAAEEPISAGYTDLAATDRVAVAFGQREIGVDQVGRGTDSGTAMDDSKGSMVEQSGLPGLLRGTESAALAALVGRATERLTLSAPVGADYEALLTLYRQTAQAAAPMGRAGVSAAPVVIREEYAAGGGLTAQELDLAVRRDSRRYDGAVHIY